MSLQDAIERILHLVRDQNGNPKYVPYITKSGGIPGANDPARSDYNDTTLPAREYQIHGGVDIIYGEMVNGVLEHRGSGHPINQNVSVYSPVTGKAWNIDGTGTVKDPEGSGRNMRQGGERQGGSRSVEAAED